MKVLITCPPMRGVLTHFSPRFRELEWEIVAPPMAQTLSEADLERLLPTVDGWIAGDDPVNARTVGAGMRGRLRAVVKWGVGTDNVDFPALKKLGMPVDNTPAVFNEEVADLALGYVIALARHFVDVDREVRAGKWPKLQGSSLRNKLAIIAGFGNIGKEIARRLLFLGMNVQVADPFYKEPHDMSVAQLVWPVGIENADFVILACPLTPETKHMFNSHVIAQCKPGLRLVNVARGALVDERALEMGLQSGQIGGAALDVFEVEPLPASSALRTIPNVVLGSHNASNTREAALRATEKAIERLLQLMDARTK